MKSKLNFILYQIALWPLTPLIAAYLLREAIKRKGGWLYIKQRLGFAYKNIAPSPLWIHAASVGEVNAALPLIEEIQKHNPELSLIVTTATPTGAQALKRKNLSQVRHIYFPVDYSFAVRRFIKAVQPRAALIMETELWPNLYNTCHQHAIPLIIINARLSHKTLQANTWLRNLYSQCLQQTNSVLARSEEDKAGFTQLGASAEKTEVIGNIKFATISTTIQKHAELKKPYILAASTHHDEELQIANAWQQNKRNHLLAIAPRHPERAEKLTLQLRAAGLTVARRSLQETPNDKTDIYLIDTYGELQMFMADAELVIMGGSFIKRGGQNLLEPAALGKAIIVGADMSNFSQETVLLKKENALMQVNNPDELSKALGELLSNSDLRKNLGNNAKAVMKKHQDIAQRYYEKVAMLLRLQ